MTENRIRIWIDLNRKSYILELPKNDRNSNLPVSLFITVANSIAFISKNRSVVTGYRVVGEHCEVLDLVSVHALRDQVADQSKHLQISHETDKLINGLFEDLVTRLQANELWNSRFTATSDKDVLVETRIMWRWETLQFNVIKRWIDKNDKRIIDAPSGSGRFSIAFAREYPDSNVLGIDLLSNALALAEYGAQLQNVPNVNFQRADVLTLPPILRFQSKFDAAISIGLLQNLSEAEVHAFLDVLLQILKPAAKVIISVPNAHGPVYRLWKMVLGKSIQYRFGLERNITPQEMITLFKQHHLQEIEVEGTDPLYGLRKMYRVDPKTGSAIPFWWSNYSRALGQILDYCLIDPLDWLTKGWLSRQFGNDFIIKGKVPSSKPNAPIGVCLLSSDVEAGCLRSAIEDQYRATMGLQDKHGDQLISYQRLSARRDLECLMPPAGGLFKIRFFPEEPEEKIQDGWPILRFALPENISETFDLYARRKIYADKHLVLSFSGPHDRKQSMYLDGLRAGLRVLKGMGSGSFGFFNAATPTRDSFHYQLFGDSQDPWPIWQNLEQGLVTIEGERAYGIDDVSVGNLIGWPIAAPIFQSRSPESLASAIWKEIDPGRISKHIVADLVFTYAEDERLKVILILRDKVAALQKPRTFYPEDMDAYGTFGGMEFAGIILMKWNDRIYQSLQHDPAATAERVRMAFQETTLPFVI